MEIMPPYVHMSLESSVRAGFPPTRVVGVPGAQQPQHEGMHGMGVRTPKAAAVAAATIGLAGEAHMPNG